MDSHPIPQNVTSFQFHLIGDMTLKQFIYLAMGAGSAYLVFVFLSPTYPLVAWPLIITSTLLGISFAFLPIASRPLDLWVIAFLRAVYSPTKRVWQKNGRDYKSEPLFKGRMMSFFPPPSQPTPPPDLPTKDELDKTVELARQAQNLQFKIIQSQRALNQVKSQPQAADINKVITDLNILVSQASVVRQQLDAVTNPESIQEAPKVVAAVPPTHLKERVKIIIPQKIKQTQVALTTFPNVINGVIKDKGGTYLEGVVAVIYDKEGLPVRALKTNKLGQFSGSTPLPNGTYTLELEKDNFSFDVLQIELNGEVLPPLLITPK